MEDDYDSYATEDNSIGSQILSRKRLRIFDQITNSPGGFEEEGMEERYVKPKTTDTISFGLNLKQCQAE